MPGKQRIIFISSTCNDLIDLRATLTKRLIDHGFIVKASDIDSSDFRVNPNVDSIETCLKNVDSSDAVILVMDGRYGSPLPASTAYANKSATQVEMEHAKKIGKATFGFMRNRAWTELEQMRTNPSFIPKWVEPDNPDRLKLWKAFAEQLAAIPDHAGRNNWFDQFDNCLDLCDIVIRRLTDEFPDQSVITALNPDRFVRMVFNLERVDNESVLGQFKNLGPGPALTIEHGGSYWNNSPPPTQGATTQVRFSGGIAEGEVLKTQGNPNYSVYDLRERDGRRIAHIYCQYHNRYGDRYMTIVGVRGSPGIETQWVWNPNKNEWVQV
jgi:hypothetical protein